MSIQDYFKQHTVKELIENTKVLFLHKDDSLVSALKLFVEHNILSAPVVKERVSEPTGQDVDGIVSMLDLVVYLVEKIYTPKTNVSTSLRDLFQEAEKRQMATTVVSSFIDASSRSPHLTVSQNSTVYDAIKLMAEKSAQRVIVINDNNKIVSFLTQSSILKFVSAGLDRLNDLAEKSLADVGLADKKPVHTVTFRQHAWEAFKLMSEKKITAVGVLDEEGKLIGNISHRDIRLVNDHAQGVERLHSQVSAFLIKMQKEFGSPDHIVVLKPTDTVKHFLQTLNKYSIHRIYVVDEHGAPIRVVSLSDLFGFLVGSH